MSFRRESPVASALRDPEVKQDFPPKAKLLSSWSNWGKDPQMCIGTDRHPLLRPRLSPCANRWHLDEFLSSPRLEPLPKLTRTLCFSLGPQLSPSESRGSPVPCQLGAPAKYQFWVQFACSSASLASPDGLDSLSPPKHVTLPL